STYLEALDEERQRSEQARVAAEANQAAALAALTSALDRLAAGDLTVRIDQQLASEFDKLKSDFEATAAKLQEAMASIRLNAQAISSGSQE
ncbi:HAMP domain-containing protein, partial [Microbacteriaceae bacterium K1510]|nr:HAMP domain-containing protein [Microbacteriaceae bacterium K1510]